MLGALERIGFDLDALLSGARLRRSDIEDPDAYISPRVCAEVFARAQAEHRVANLPLEIAGHTPVGSQPLLDYLIVSSDSVAQGLQRLAQYLRLVNPRVRVATRPAGDLLRVTVEAPLRFEVELTVAISVLRFAAETGGRLKPAYVSFTHEPGDASEYVRALRCPVRVKATWDGWAVTQESARLPLRRRDPRLQNWLERLAADALARTPVMHDLAGEVRRLLAASATAAELRIDAVARRLAVTPRTLQRRLARQGTSFDALRDETRRQAAATYLADPGLSIAEVACLLGYSDPSVLHRAFKRWHGVTVRTFRQQHGG